MACNCGKNRRNQPTGADASPADATVSGRASSTSRSSVPTGARAASSATQGQAAPASRATQQSFTLGSGRATQSFGSALERDAAYVRSRKGRRQVD